MNKQQIEFKPSELGMIHNALIIAQEVWKRDAEQTRALNQYRIADQFRRQVLEAGDIIEKLEKAGI